MVMLTIIGFKTRKRRNSNWVDGIAICKYDFEENADFVVINLAHQNG